MPELTLNKNPNKIFFIAAFVIMLSIAFFQCYKTTHDLQYAFDVDFDRDVSFAQSLMDGHYGQDPNYKGEFLWYNPMVFAIEAAISKLTSLPPSAVAAQAGTFLNFLSPLVFLLMAVYFFGLEVALAALFAFLFVRADMVNGGTVYGYSPWLYPFCFAQFAFYMNIIFCYKAFSSQKYIWFVLLGVGIGISFLAHAAPTILIILILVSIQFKNMIGSIKQNHIQYLKKYFFQGAVVFGFFILAAMPLLYYVAGKYHLHVVNKDPMEYTEGMFYMSRIGEMIKKNLSVALVVSILGFIWFYKNFHQPLIRSIILNWLVITVIMYVYTTVQSFLGGERYNIHLPGTVPSFHYYYYIKVVQFIFFGFGFVFLFRLLWGWLGKAAFTKPQSTPFQSIFLATLLVLLALAVYPSYQKRPDFTIMRDLSVARQKNYGKIEVYHFIMQHIPEDEVILCERKDSISFFPVMATARKMVCTEGTFSNPYIDFYERENDRESMLSYLRTGTPDSARKLFGKYGVNYVLISAKRLNSYKSLQLIPQDTVFRNEGFAIFKLKK
ncbi:MAG TPA: hypothetical protein VMT76_12500 [Puia sp.]|nr:hypothetical protein [Puia sp.]